MGGSPFHGIFSALGQSSGWFGSGKPSTGAMMEHMRGDGASEAQAGRLAVDIYDQDDYTIIRAPIAGIRMSDIDIEVNENVLTIRGSRRLSDSIPDDQYYLRECFVGPFARSVTLPGPVDPRKVRATFSKDCVLKILIPKEEKVKIVKINEV